MADEVTLKELVESRISALEQARKTAERSMEKRLDGMNEFRETLSDQAGRMATKEHVLELRDRLEIQINLNAKAISDLQTFRAVVDSKASQGSLYISVGIAVLGLILSFISLATVFLK